MKVGYLSWVLLATTAALAQQQTIHDVALHRRWILLPDPAHPGGPARLVETVYDAASPQSRQLVIHAGDKVVLCHHSKDSIVQLEATALNPAAVGETLKVRLRFGKSVLTVKASAPGQVDFLPVIEGSSRP